MQITAQTSLLLAGLLATQFAIYAVGWAATVPLLAGRGESLRAWAGLMAALSIGFLLLALRDDSRSWMAYVGADIAFVGGHVLLWIGLARFLRADGVRREPWLWLALGVVALVLVGPAQARAAWRCLAAYGAEFVITLRLLLTLWQPLQRDVGSHRIVRLQQGLGMVMVGIAAVGVLRQLVHFDQSAELHRMDLVGVAMMFVYLVAAGIFNFAFLILTTGRLMHQLHEQGRRDALTGLFNRRAHEERLALEWQRHQRHGHALALLLIDLDHFKRINDAHGHAVGDAVLVQAARRMQALARSVDGLARIGGEEFVLLMPDTDLAGAALAAERLRAALSEPMRVEARTIPVSASIGVAAALPGDAGAETLLRRADDALYAAKSAGRNRVAQAPAVLAAAEA